MPVPSTNITLTGTFVDMQGAAVNGGTVTAVLQNYGGNVPQLSGSATLETVSTSVTMTATNTFSMALYGNDQITPTGTYYALTFPGPGAQSTTKNYQLTGVGSFDLSNLTPFGSNPIPQSQPGQTLVQPLAAVAHQFVTGLSVSGGLITGQPTYSDISGSTKFGTGSAGTSVTTTTKGGGTGPTTAQTVVAYLQITLGSTVYYVPLMQ